jgi:hypothetical protein
MATPNTDLIGQTAVLFREAQGKLDALLEAQLTTANLETFELDFVHILTDFSFKLTKLCTTFREQYVK